MDVILYNKTSKIEKRINGHTVDVQENIDVTFIDDYAMCADSEDTRYGKSFEIQHGYDYVITGYVNIEKYKSLLLSVIRFISNSVIGLVFYSDNVTSHIPGNIVGSYVFPDGAESSTPETNEINIPDGAKYFRTTYRTIFPFVCKGIFEGTEGSIEQLDEKVNGQYVDVDETVETTLYSDRTIIADTSRQDYGETSSELTPSLNYQYSDFTNIEKYKAIRITMLNFVNAVSAGIVFYSDDVVSNIPNNVVTSYLCRSGAPSAGYEERVFEIPSGAKYFRTTFKSTYTFICKGIFEEKKGGIDELAEEVKEIKENGAIGQQWKGKSWYGYGTSITDTSTKGKYPIYLAEMSGLEYTNKGIGGGGIGDLGAYSAGQVYDAICNITDGKLEADLITLETGANDCNANVPLGTIYDTGTNTLAGCLNDCIRYLQANTDAQICIINSPSSTTEPNAENQVYIWADMVEKICHMNRVHFIRNDCNMGYAKISDATKGSLYVEDNIHQTNLGGYIMAENIWYQLRNIPLFYTEIPS